MNKKTYQVEILTPCFCAGADPSKAEIRAPSIRGELRWWFRVLGGTWEQEKMLFGGVHPGKYKHQENHPLAKTRASALVVRITGVQRAKNWPPPGVNRNDPLAYIWHFASVSGERKGMRWTAEGNVPPESRFNLSLAMRYDMGDNGLEERLGQAVEAFLRFGGMGLRITRGLGGIQAPDLPAAFDDYRNAAERLLQPAAVSFLWIEQSFPDWKLALTHAGELLKNVLRKQENAKRTPESPLGNSSHPRQTSAVRFRVIKTTDAGWRLLLFEAPHERVLETKSRRPRPMLDEYCGGILTH